MFALGCGLSLLCLVHHLLDSVVFQVESPFRDVKILRREPGMTDTSAPSNRTEIRHVAFLKVHKTGSTSLQNIFIRFGESRNSTFILGRAKGNECNGWASCISLNDTIREANIVPPPKDRNYDMLCSHVIYSSQQFARYLPRDTAYVASVREPVSRLASSAAHYHLIKSQSFAQFAENPTRYRHPMLNNRMAFEFGFKQEWFPTEYHKSLTDNETVEVLEYIRTLNNEFKLILVNERIDESLVLMRRLLSWTTGDVVYHRKRYKVYRYSPLRQEDEASLRLYLYLDNMLYESVLREFERKLADAGPGFEEEVREFRVIGEQVNDFCNKYRDGETLVIEGARWADPFTVDKQYCANLMRAEGSYMNKIRLKQYGTLDTI